MHEQGCMACHAKIGPLKSVRPDQVWQKSLPMLVPRTTFAAKIGPACLILAAKTGPPVKINLQQFIAFAS